MGGRARRLAALALTLLGVAVAGCGSEPKSDEDQVRDAVLSLYAAAGRGDGEAVCDRLEDGLRDLERATAGGSCDVIARDIGRSRVEDLRVVDVDINGTAARAQAETRWGSGAVDLRREGGGWRISSLPALDEHFEFGG